MKAYKIIELDDSGNARTLFHGYHNGRIRTKKLPIGYKLQAEIKRGRDGSGEQWYETGWHTLLTLEAAIEYMSKFKARRDKLRVAECEIENYWIKKHSPAQVLLSEFITIAIILKESQLL